LDFDIGRGGYLSAPIGTSTLFPFAAEFEYLFKAFAEQVAPGVFATASVSVSNFTEKD
jgi:hypothetical protein